MNNIVYSIDWTYEYLRQTINMLCEEYTFIKKEVIGRSCAGRDIFALKIGDGTETVLYTAATHGSEHITTNIAVCFIENICRALKEGTDIAGISVRRAMYGRAITVIPCVNPDGCEISVCGETGAGQYAGRIKRICEGDFTHWNANLRGVDINHNFDAGWAALHELERKSGIFGPAPTRFGGYAPETEPETAALCNLCRKISVRHAAALHTQGQCIYWSYGEREPRRSKKMAEILATQSGYALEVPTGLAVGGGFKDWFIEKFNKPGFTLEIGKGTNPLPIDLFYRLYSEVEEILMLIGIM